MLQVSLSAHASMDMPLEPVADAAKGLSTALPEPQLVCSPPALQQQIPAPHQHSSSEHPESTAETDKPDASPPVHRVRGGSAGSSDGGDELGLLHLRDAPPGVGRGPPGDGGSTGDRRPRRMVSLLARGLADQAAAAAAPPVVVPAALLQPPADVGGGNAAGAKPKRSAAWLLGLPHITTVRRMGKTDT